MLSLRSSSIYVANLETLNIAVFITTNLKKKTQLVIQQVTSIYEQNWKNQGKTKKKQKLYKTLFEGI